MLDIGDILDGWPYKPGEVNVRRIRGADGREKYQMRLDLGLLQMELTGRPDGMRPEGCESLFAHFENRLEKHRAEHGADEVFSLTPEACRDLRAEGAMYYHRYLAAFLLGDFDVTCRDTHRNLRLFDFLHAHGAEEDDRRSCEGYRPYVLRMYASARAKMDIKKDDLSHAVAVLNQTIEQIGNLFRERDSDSEIESSRDLEILKTMCSEVREMIPLDPRQRLKRQLKNAVNEERYEDAAYLRDKLNRSPGGPGRR